MSAKKIGYFAALVLSLGLQSCVSMQIDSTLHQQLDPMLGQSKDYVSSQMSAPTDIKSYGEYEVFVYYMDNGTRTSAYVSSNQYGAYGNASQRQSYLMVRLYFRNDVFERWDYRYQ
jgi:hypothetical protein